MRLRPLWLSLGLMVIGLCTVVPHFVLQALVEKPEFKSIAEKRVSELLDAPVEIGEIRALFFNQIALKRLSVASSDASDASHQILVREIIFRYDIFRLLSRQLEVPSAIVLDAPEISLQKGLLPYSLLKNMHLKKGRGAVAQLDLRGGNIDYELTDFGTRLSVEQIQGSIHPIDGQIIKVDFKAVMRGALNGVVRIRGEIDPADQTQRLEISLDSVGIGEKIPLPLKELKGIVRWEDDDFYFDELDATVHGWNVSLTGKLLHFTEKPDLQVYWKVGKVESLAQGDFRLDLQAGILEGRVTPSRRRSKTFRGDLEQQGDRLLFSNLEISENYNGQGWMDIRTGDYQFDINRNGQRISLASNLTGLDMDMNFDLSHVRFIGLDLVTSIAVRVRPVQTQWQKRQWQFDCAFDADYFILEYTPLEDFKGTFLLSPQGMKNFTSTWGQAFHLEGHIDFQGDESSGKLTLKVKDFDLSGVKDFASKPLPDHLGGLLEGKLMLEGMLKALQADGKFVIKGGRLGKLDFDRGIVQFEGIPPYFRLYDSRILKGRTTLDLEGAIDLSLSNILAGIQIKTGDQLIIWKGWEATGAQGEDVEIEKPGSGLPTLVFKTGDQNQSALVKDSDQKDEGQYLAVGPKFKF